MRSLLRLTVQLVPVFIGVLLTTAHGKESLRQDDTQLTISADHGLEFHVIKEGFRYGFRQHGRDLVRAHPIAGLLAGDPESLSSAKSTRYLGSEGGLHRFQVTLADGNQLKVGLQISGLTARFELEESNGKTMAMALRSAEAAGPGYGLGDLHIRAKIKPTDERGAYHTEITGFESYDYHCSSAFGARMVSNFAIYPTDRFALINIDPKPKIVVHQADEIIQGSRDTKKIESFYYFFGSPKEIYASFLKARNLTGFPVMKPDYELYGVGWEAWGALAWNTSQKTVLEDIDRYLEIGYPLSWAVVGSGFWPQQEDKYKATTSFGMWDEQKYPDPNQFKQDLKERNLRFLIGLRIAFLPDGPFTDHALKNDFFLKENGIAKLHTVGFPKAPVHLLDASNPKAVEWYVSLCDKWGVDGFKEDLYRYEKHQLTDDKLDPVNIALKKKGYSIIVRNAYLSSPGSLHRIEDFNYDMNQDRGPVNTLTLAYSGFPLTYMDIVGGMFGGREFDGEVSSRIKTYLMRNARIASLHSSMSMGKGPWNYRDPLVSKVLLDSAKLHDRLQPYIHSNAIKFYRDGYPHTMTPLPIAYPEDPNVHHRENSHKRGFQWMIGDALLTCPLYGEDYENTNHRDVYLPSGTWIDYDSGKQFTGPKLLENFEMPVTKTPLFVGGSGIVIEKVGDELMARIYPVANQAESIFYGKDGETTSKITIANPDWAEPSITNSSTGKKVTPQLVRDAYQFKLTEGQNYHID